MTGAGLPSEVHVKPTFSFSWYVLVGFPGSRVKMGIVGTTKMGKI